MFLFNFSLPKKTFFEILLLEKKIDRVLILLPLMFLPPFRWRRGIQAIMAEGQPILQKVGREINPS